MSRPGLRVYKSMDQVPSVYKNRGVSVLSTNKGVMTDYQARQEGVGGEVLFHVW